MLRVVLLGVAFCISGAFAQTNFCHLTIELKLKTGESRTVQFIDPVPTGAECAHRARLQSINFSPREVATKKVTYRWQAK